jgi:hypothetical protein
MRDAIGADPRSRAASTGCERCGLRGCGAVLVLAPAAAKAQQDEIVRMLNR